MKIELKIIGEFIHHAKKKNKQKNATQKKHRSIALVEGLGTDCEAKKKQELLVGFG